jgi:hypothetical protein
MGNFMFFQGFVKSGKNICGCHLQVKQAAEFLSTSLPTASFLGGIDTP